jgi:hypothetical protein
VSQQPQSVRLNELMPVPQARDWDRDGTADAQDEWIELYNVTRRNVDISGWKLEVTGQSGTVASYTFPRRTALQGDRYLLLFQSDTDLVLDDAGGRVRLLNAEGDVVDQVTYGRLTADTSYSRVLVNNWSSELLPSPGEPNVAGPALRGKGRPTPMPTRIRPVR